MTDVGPDHMGPSKLIAKDLDFILNEMGNTGEI